MTLVFGGKDAHEVFGALAHPRFELEHELGHGGFGVVWSAWDKEHAQRVAVKVLHRKDASALRRFKGEFRALANLTHENLVSLYELHQDDERWFFTMELVDGTTFYDWVVPPAAGKDGLPAARVPSMALTRPARPSAKASSQGRSRVVGDAAPAPLMASPLGDEPVPDRDRHAASSPIFMETTPSEAAVAAFAQTSPDVPIALPNAPEAVKADSAGAAARAHPTPLAVPEPFHGIDVPDAETYATWDALRPGAASEPAPRVDFVRLRAAFHQLTQALAWLHGSGHLHRDVKPSNVLVTKGGVVKVLDFGLVTRLLSVELAPLEALVGTPVYMSPELCAGLSASPASDWYSVGVMLYTILTGRLPFTGDVERVILAKQGLEARRPREVVTGELPDDLDTLCTALLSRNPVLRPDIGAMLATFAGGDLAAQARSPGAAESAVALRPHALLGAFVGRASEVSRLAAILPDPARALAPGTEALVVLVEGLSGVGKTSLVEHVLREAEGRGDLVLRSRCFERGSVRFRALDGAVDDLARWLAQLARSEVEALMPADAVDRAALARLFPVLPRLGSEPSFDDDVDPIEIKRRAFRALRGLLVAVSTQRRVLVEIDDAQWSDDDSLAPLLELLRAPSPAIVWLIAYRSDDKDQSAFLRSFLASALPLVPPERRITIELGPLPVDEAVRLAAERLGNAPNANPDNVARARAIAHEAGGHPLLIDELALAAVAEVGDSAGASPSERLSALLGARIASLPQQARTIVELVAVAAEPVDVRLVRAATGADQRDLNRLITERLLRARPGGHGETVVAWHDRVRECATALLDHDTRVRRHRALAETGERLGNVDPFFLYVHWRGAGDDARARGFAIASAEAAQRAFAFDRAADLYASAIALSNASEPALLERLADAKKNAGRGVEAGRAYLDAAAALRVIGDGADHSAELRRLEIAAAEQFIFAGGLAEGQAVIGKVMGEIGVSMARSVPAVMASMMWQSLRLKLRGSKYALRPEAETSPAARAVVDTLWSATIGMSMAHPLTSVAIQKRHLRLALNLGEPLRLMRALSIELAFSGLPGGAPGTSADRASLALSERAHAAAANVPHAYAEAFVSMSDGATHWLRGRWKAAGELVGRALQVYETACVGVTWEKDTARFVALAALFHQGAVDALRPQVERALQDATQRGDLFIDTQLRTRFLPILQVAADEADAVEATVSAALARWTAHGYQVVHLYGWMSRIEALLYLGRAVEARAIFDAGVRPLKRSFILMGQYYRIQFDELAGRIALANGDTKRALASARRLRKERIAWALPFADLLVGRATEDAASLASAATGFAANDMVLHGMAADLAHARLVRDDPRADDITAAAKALGLRDAPRVLSMFLGA